MKLFYYYYRSSPRDLKLKWSPVASINRSYGGKSLTNLEKLVETENQMTEKQADNK